MVYRNISCIGGWGIDPSVSQKKLEAYFPKSFIHSVAPTPHSLLQIPPQTDLLIGYSLGGRLVAEFHDLISNCETCLLAPALSIQKEDERGGKISARSLQAMSVNFIKNPKKQLFSFQNFVGCSNPILELPYEYEYLIWGLEYLSKRFPLKSINECFKCFIGEEDPLMDASIFKESFSKNAQVLKQTGHRFEDLLNAIKKC